MLSASAGIAAVKRSILRTPCSIEPPGIAPVRDYIETRYVLHVPRAILAAGLATLSLLSITAGLILDTISRFHQETVELMKFQRRKRP